MATRSKSFAGALVARAGRIYTRPSEGSLRLLARLSFAEGAALYQAVLRIARRQGGGSDAGRAADSPYDALTGKRPLAAGPSRGARGRREKVCIRCEFIGDGGAKCYRVPCEKPVA